MTSAAELTIGGRKIGPGRPVFIVAELSANHQQSFENAVQLIRIAKDCGADAVKLQTYTADTLTIRSEQPWFRIGGESPWRGRSLYELYQQAATPWDWYPRLNEVATTEGLLLFSTPFDALAVQFLEQLDCPAYKIASFELVDTPLLQVVAQTGKPMILSTGMATLAEIREAVSAIRATGATQWALLKCTSAYPTSAREMNLRALGTLSREFQVPIGLSDHSLELAAPAAAVALGATIIEKHLTPARSAGGPDGAFSLEPDEFRAMVRAVRTVEAALGTGEIGPSEGEAACRELRRSLFAVAEIGAGEVLTAENVRSIRPGAGLAPKELTQVLGRRAKVAIARGTPLAWSLIE